MNNCGKWKVESPRLERGPNWDVVVAIFHRVEQWQREQAAKQEQELAMRMRGDKGRRQTAEGSSQTAEGRMVVKHE